MASSLDAIILEKGPDILKRLEERSSVAQIIEPEKFDKFKVLSEILGYAAQQIGARYIGISEIRLVPEIGKELQHIDDGVFYNKERFLALARSIDTNLSDKEKLNAHPLYYQEADVYWYSPDCEIMEEGEEMIGPIEPKKFSQMRGIPSRVFNLKETICFCKNEDYMTKLLLDDSSESKFKNFDDYLVSKLKYYVSDMIDLGKPVNPEKIDYSIALTEFREFIKGLDLAKRYSSQQGIDFNYVIRSNSAIEVPIIAFDAAKNEEVALGVLDINDIPEWDLEPLSSEAMAMLGKIAGKVAPSIAQAYQAHQWKVINQKLKETQAQLIQSERISSIGRFAAGAAHTIRTPLASLVEFSKSLDDSYDNAIDTILKVRTIMTEAEMPIYRQVSGLALEHALSREPLSDEQRDERKSLFKRVLMERGLSQKDAAGAASLYTMLKFTPDDFQMILPLLESHKEDSMLITQSINYFAGNKRKLRANSQNAARIGTIIGDMMALMRKKENAIETIDINKSLENLINVAYAYLPDVKFEQQYDHTLPQLSCYSAKLDHLWSTILGNAVDAIKATGHNGKITVETYKKNGYIGVRVTDDGIGVPEEIRPKLFIEQVTTKKEGEGLGIGLYLGSKIVEENKGKISYISEKGKTSFEVLLPIAGVEDK